MPREVHDREDLLRDARALVPRVTLQFRLGESRIALFAGFRGDAISLYFGNDPVFHFNAEGELRRAFVHGQLIKAERGRLVDLDRDAAATAIELTAREFTAARQQQFLNNLTGNLAELRTSLESGQFTLVGQEPPEGDALPRLRAWLAAYETVTVAASPGVG